jgi:5'-nucleotidase
MTFLLTNDDGIDAPGIAVLHTALSDRGAVDVVAPATERSGASHALTMHEVLRSRPMGSRRWAVAGTPVDCVYVAVHKLLAQRPSMVVSGINRGANLGDDVHYSGTVGAAREGALMGIPALAVSLHVDHVRARRLSGSPHFDTAAHFALQVIDHLADNPLPPTVFLNLNVPDVPMAEVLGLRVCGLGRRHYAPMVEERRDPRNRPYFWIGGDPIEGQMDAGTDGWWAEQGWATLTPIQLDSTAVDTVAALQSLETSNDRV